MSEDGFLDHPLLGTLRYQVNDAAWIGRAGDHELVVGGDSWDPYAPCLALAEAEIPLLEPLLPRIDAFLETVRDPYLDQWKHRGWQVLSLVFRGDEESSRFVVEYLLDRDEYTVWQVTVENGHPVALGRR